MKVAKVFPSALIAKRFEFTSFLFGLVLFGLVAPSFGQTIVYQDSFDNDGLGVNVGVGGGLTNRTIFAHSWADNGNLQFNTAGTQFQRRALVFSNNTFQSAGGFELSVNYFNNNYGGASYISFGLLSDDTDFSTYNQFNPFRDNNGANDSNTFGFGATTDSGVFSFTDGTDETILENGAPLPLAVNTDVVLSFLENGSGGANWSWSVGGTDRNSGTIAAFDFSKNYHFVAYGQDDQGNKRINSVSLAAIALQEDPIMMMVDNAAIGQLIASAIPTNIAVGQIASEVHGTASRNLNNRLFGLRSRLGSEGGLARTRAEGRRREVSASRLVRLEREFKIRNTIDLDGRSGAAVPAGNEVYETAILDDRNPIIPTIAVPAGAYATGKGWETFTAVDYGNYDLNPLGQNAGVQSRTYAGTVGAEFLVNPNLAVGLGLTRVENDNDLSGGLGAVDLDGFAFSGYASYFKNNFWGDLLYSHGDYEADISRNTLLGSTVGASPDIDAHKTTLNLGYNLAGGDRVVHGPTFRADYSFGKLEGYTESGDPRANTTFQAQDYESFITTLGWQVNWKRDTQWGEIQPQLRLGYGRENHDRETNVSGTLQNSPIAFVQGGNVIGTGGTITNTLNREDPGEGWMEVGAGVAFTLRNDLTLSVDYQGRYFQQDAQLHLGTITAGWKF